MAKTKKDWLDEAQAAGLAVTEKNTVAEIKEALESTRAVAEAEPKVEAEATTEEVAVAKAGKRSAKAVREAEAAEAKEARKESADEEVEANKGPKPVTRSLLERRSKAYRKAHEKLEADKAYDLKDAAKLAIETSTVKFDATVEMHIRLNVDPRQADQNIRDSISLPHGTGKSVTVAAFVENDDAAAAKKAGADFAGEDEIMAKLNSEQLDFDVLIAPPKLMAKLGKFAKILGPKGLMPNPKSGTVSNNVNSAIKEAKAGRVEYRVDAGGIIHLGIGKTSFGADKIAENAGALLDSIRSNRPGTIKGVFLQSVTLSSSMGPGVKVAFEQKVTL